MSASIIGFLFIYLLIIANVVSNIGRPNANTGTANATTATLFTIPETDVTASIYPSNKEPVSPMKIFAGLKLKGKNPSEAPAIIAHCITMKSCPNLAAVNKRVVAAMLATPEASPSSPSIKFIVFVIPTNQNNVITKDNQSNK